MRFSFDWQPSNADVFVTKPGPFTDLAIAAISVLLPHVRSGALKALAVTSPQRYPLAPDIPTAAEAGLAELQIDGWICVMVTGGTPESVVVRLDQEIAKALAVPEIRDTFARQGVDIAHMNPNQLGAFLRAEAARFKILLKNSRISEVIITNTLPVPHDKQFDKLTVLSIAPLLARAINEVFNDGSVTSLFDGQS